MTTKTRPLTASLHTVTAVTRVAVELHRVAADAGRHWTVAESPDGATVAALEVLGYQAESDELLVFLTSPNPTELSPLLQKCLDSVRKALAGGAR